MAGDDTKIDWSSSQGHHLENLQSLLQKGHRIFSGESESKQKRLAEHYLNTLPQYEGFPFNERDVLDALSDFVGETPDRTRVLRALQRALADLPELAPPSRIPTVPKGSKWSFIVYDDDKDFVERLRELLDAIAGPDSYDLKHAQNEKQLLKSVSANTDLVFLDLYDQASFVGYTALSTIQRSVPSVPVFVCTSDQRPQTAWEMVRAGAAGVLTKTRDGAGIPSVEPEELEIALASACTRRAHVPFHRPAPVEVEDPNGVLEDIADPEVVERLLSMLFPGKRRVQLVRSFTDGKSDAHVWLAKLDDHSAPVVIKFGHGERLLGERESYLRFVRDDIGNSAGRIERPGALVFERASHNDRATYSAISYTVAGSSGLASPQTLLERFQADPTEATTALCELTKRILPSWYQGAEAQAARPWLWWGYHLGVVGSVKNAKLVPFAYGTDSWEHETRATGTVDLLRTNGSVTVVISADKPRGYQFRIALADDPGLWLREGRKIAVEGEKTRDEERLADLRRTLRHFDKGGPCNGVAPVSRAIHGDLHLANVLVQPGNPGQPWLIDFAATGPGCPIWDLVRLEADLVLRVMSKHSHRWASWTSWAEDVVLGRSPADLSWFGDCVGAIRDAARDVYEDAGLASGWDAQYRAILTAYLLGMSKWMNGGGPYEEYLRACQCRDGFDA